MRILKISTLLILLIIITVDLSDALAAVQLFSKPPSAYQGSTISPSKKVLSDSSKSNVFIIADNKLTELFDMLAPFYLFNLTEKANVYIVAKDKTPILIKRNLYVLPQITFKEADALNLRADVIIIPALSIRDEHQDTLLLGWIKSHVNPGTKMLAICDGASTAAATGLYDGKYLTCHASDYVNVKSHFKNPVWVKNVNVTKSGNLFSTAGVSNAVEGSLTIINELYGKDIANAVISAIHYPGSRIKVSHQSIAISSNDKWIIAKKVIFKSNKNIGLLLETGMDEFKMVSILDTYGRTFPKSFKTFYIHDSIIQSKYGLTVIATGNNKMESLDELHILTPKSGNELPSAEGKGATIVTYTENQYPIDICLKRISIQYGPKFENVVKVLLDYN